MHNLCMISAFLLLRKNRQRLRVEGREGEKERATHTTIKKKSRKVFYLAKKQLAEPVRRIKQTNLRVKRSKDPGSYNGLSCRKG